MSEQIFSATASSFPLTPAGRALLLEELDHRLRTERPRLVERLKAAINDDVNLAENAEYQTILTEQETNEARIVDLEDKLARAEVVDPAKLSGKTIRFGATVSVVDEDTGQRRVWQIVGEPEADATHGKISVSSPVARALIGKSKGDTVEVQTPGGVRAYMVDKINWQQAV
jgi:transcription elongation factor GreA